MVKLIIDTSEIQTVRIVLKTKEQSWSKESKSHKERSQSLLPLIEELLNEHGLTVFDLKEIEVNPGPGSFTGLRVGLTIANSLGNLLNIPVNGKKIPILPKYS